jgi:glyoxylase-like metal-dependent hydrolase (beta-lactamase superfamily II)
MKGLKMTTTSKATKRTKKSPAKSAKKASRPRVRRSSKKPDKLTLRSYQVGFGDCYLLTFHYGAESRHVLIDFGSTALPPDLPKDQMLRVANDIRERCGGEKAKLNVVVATHRHKDHISGFTTNKDGGGTGDVIAGLAPGVVRLRVGRDELEKA